MDDGGSENQSAAETSRLARQESFAASDGGSGGWYFGGGSNTEPVADSSATADQSPAEDARLARQESFAAGPATGGSGGWYFGGLSSASDASPVGKQVKDFYNKVSPVTSLLGAIVGFFANPPLTFVKLAVQNADKIGQPNPYGPTFNGHSGGYVSALPAPGSFAAQQSLKAAPAGISTSYLGGGSNPGGYGQTTQNTGGAVAVLAVLATLALAT